MWSTEGMKRSAYRRNGRSTSGKSSGGYALAWIFRELTAVAEVIEFAISERMRPLLALRAEAVAGAYDMTAEELNELFPWCLRC